MFALYMRHGDKLDDDDITQEELDTWLAREGVLARTCQRVLAEDMQGVQPGIRARDIPRPQYYDPRTWKKILGI